MRRIVTESREKIIEFVANGALSNASNAVNYAAIGIEEDGELVGGVVYYDFNGRCITASIRGIGNWLNREFLWYMFHYPFIEANAVRLTATVDIGNEISHNFVKRLGFVHEATLQRAGKFGDIVVYRMFREDCKWLSLKPLR